MVSGKNEHKYHGQDLLGKKNFYSDYKIRSLAKTGSNFGGAGKTFRK